MKALTAMPTYEAYKESGVEWLGDIPNSWNVKPGMIAFSENKRNNKGMKEDRVLSLSYGNIVIKPPEKLTGLVPESFETYQLVEPGDIIIRCMDLQNDKESLRFGLARDIGIITSAYLNLKVKEGFISKYLYYYFHALDITKVIYKFGSGLRQNLSYEDFRRLPIFEIPLVEQTAIANFLDRKTAQIDQAIAIKEKQIALLKERKQILIQNAATRGLDPNVPMKDSGVECIGEIPEHWDIKRLKYLINSSTGFAFPSNRFQDTGLPVVRIGELNASGYVVLDDAPCLPEKFQYYLREYGLQSGDILMAMTGGTIGKVAEYLVQDSALLNQRVCRFSAMKTILREYALFWMKTQYWQEYINLNASGGAQPNISDDQVLELPISLPKDIGEQQEIVISLRSSVLMIDKSIDLGRQQIEKLKEYKSTLINSAVTGKIKVT